MINISYLVKNIFVVIVLGICFFQDLKYKKIYLGAPILCIVAFISGDIILGDMNPGKLLFDMLPGFIVLVVAVIKKEMIGAGDGIVIIMTGMAVGGENILFLVMMAFGAAIVYFTVCNTIYRIRKRSDRKKEIPFVPCISVGYLFVIAEKIICL